MQIILKKRRFRDKSYKLSPIMLPFDQEVVDNVAELITTFEANLGTKNTNFYESDTLFQKFEDGRILKGLNSVLFKFFYSYENSGSKNELEPIVLRKILYKFYLNSDYSFVLPKNKEKIFQDLSDNHGIELVHLKKEIFSDHTIFKELVRNYDSKDDNNAPLPFSIIELYNFEVLKTCLKRAYWINFKFNSSNIEGTSFKNLLFLAKRSGIHYESNRIDLDTVEIRLLGPQELVGRSNKYGKNLWNLILKNLLFFSNNDILIDATINFFGQKRNITLDIAEILPLLGSNFEIEAQEISEFDSEIEKRFHNIFKSLDDRWNITREPVIIEDGIIMIPDFKLTFYDIEVFVEIVGFWTDRYLNHKIRKVKLLENKYHNKLILFIDEKLPFGTTKLKSFNYGKNLNVTGFLHYLKDNYETPYLEKKVIDVNNQKTEILNKIFSLTYKSTVIEFKEVLQDVPELQNHETMELLLIKNFFTEVQHFPGIFCIKSSILINREYLSQIQKKIEPLFLSSNNLLFEELLEAVKTDININKEILRLMLKILGYHWKIRNLINEYIYSPTQISDIEKIPNVVPF